MLLCLGKMTDHNLISYSMTVIVIVSVSIVILILILLLPIIFIDIYSCCRGL